MTLQTGRPSTEVDLPHWHSEVFGGSPTQKVRYAQDLPLHGSRLVACSDVHEVNLLLPE